LSIDGSLPFAYLTTTGRRSGRPHRIEIWFGHEGGSTIYLMAGGGTRSDWVANLIAAPEVTIEIGGTTFTALARVLEEAEEAAVARRLLFEKYQRTYNGDLSDWRDSALPVAIEITP
jgi:deazaflavin-dependent oxidoreductase (nitroreductase family)